MKYLLTLVVVFLAGREAHGECDYTALQVCTQPIMDATQSGNPDLTALCNAFETVGPCISQAGCDAFADQYAASLEQSKQLCAGRGAQGECDYTALQACIQPITDATQSGSPDLTALCNAYETVGPCISQAGCDAFADQFRAVMEQSEQLCAGRGAQGECDYTVLQACIQPITDDGQSDSPDSALCKEYFVTVDCLAEKGCDLTDIGAFDTSLAQKVTDVGRQCSDAVTSTVSMITMVAGIVLSTLCM